MVRHYRRKTVERWSKSDLIEALRRILSNQQRIPDAVKTFGISRATLYRYLKWLKMMGGGSDENLDQIQFNAYGGCTILTQTEENILSTTVVEMRTRGLPITASDVKQICFDYCEANGVPNKFKVESQKASNDWYYGFIKRHPECQLQRPGKVGGGSSGRSDNKKGAARDNQCVIPDEQQDFVDLILGSTGVEKTHSSQSDCSDEDDNFGKANNETNVAKSNQKIAEEMQGEGNDKGEEEHDDARASDTGSGEETEESEVDTDAETVVDDCDYMDD